MAEAVRDYGKLALDVIRLVGGKENITSAARCATRLRLVLKSTPEDAEEKIKALPGVITVVQKQGQFQVVIGNHVGDVFEVVSRELKLEEKEGDQPAQKESLLNRLLQMMSGVFAPICYILAAGGLIQGVLIIVSMLAPSVAETGAYQIFDMISWTPFTFLPVLIAITASRHFKCNTFIAVACCLALVNPTWTEMAGRIAEGESIKFLFADLTEITYTSSVLPPLVLIAILAVLERFLNKHLRPEWLRFHSGVYPDRSSIPDGCGFRCIPENKREILKSQCPFFRNHGNLRYYRAYHLRRYSSQKEALCLCLYLRSGGKYRGGPFRFYELCICGTAGTGIYGKFYFSGESQFFYRLYGRLCCGCYRDHRSDHDLRI